MLRTALILLGLTTGSLFAQSLPIDRQATKETRNLYRNLQKASKKGTMFGHQDDLGYGVNWRAEAGRSDVKDVTGEYPAVFGWDLGRIELDSTKEIDGIPFESQRKMIQQVYAQGGVNTFSWHLNNPVDPTKTSWDAMDFSIRNIFSDKEIQNRYDSWLDRVATYFLSLKGPKGELIPVIFRPFHEHTGSWFWWGKDHATVDEYVKLWRYTVEYLRDKKGVHNLLYAYSTDRFTSREEYLERYPGDDVIDLVGFDIYHRPQTAKPDRFLEDTRKMVEILRTIGKEKRKYTPLPKPDWRNSPCLTGGRRY
ncbi:glycoside hydrolase family 26 protein [Siphonobacter sp. SORGH_AS_0500]|uniref:glycoside hydrolase family 26 protein n=1 Tax=Siphonobacter sp. SORGH_AS_0500 TaxID=1864824 RepID=UPI001E483313|nr:glycosyl hydrolase [Siphonobacter sp. SORGH_AS_0500]